MKNVIMTIALLAGTTSFAGECVLNITREACSKAVEAESFKKCNGKASCDKKSKMANAAACAKEAEKNCENDRLAITKLKKVTAKFDGKAVEGGKNFCAADRKDHNQCNKK